MNVVEYFIIYDETENISLHMFNNCTASYPDIGVVVSSCKLSDICSRDSTSRDCEKVLILSFVLVMISPILVISKSIYQIIELKDYK